MFKLTWKVLRLQNAFEIILSFFSYVSYARTAMWSAMVGTCPLVEGSDPRRTQYVSLGRLKFKMIQKMQNKIFGGAALVSFFSTSKENFLIQFVPQRRRITKVNYFCCRLQYNNAVVEK
jgi:hypothetical protein